MTTIDERLERTLDDYRMSIQGVDNGLPLTVTHDEAKAAIKSLFLDLIEEAKPDFSEMDSYNRSFLKAMFEGYENNLKQAIGE